MNIQIQDKNVLSVMARFKERSGGYTRTVKTRRRIGDAAKMVAIELVTRPDAATAKKQAPSAEVPASPTAG